MSGRMVRIWKSGNVMGVTTGKGRKGRSTWREPSEVGNERCPPVFRDSQVTHGAGLGTRDAERRH